jgi:hypothetical protein
MDHLLSAHYFIITINETSIGKIVKSITCHCGTSAKPLNFVTEQFTNTAGI